jgi:hypothetical protein
MRKGSFVLLWMLLCSFMAMGQKTALLNGGKFKIVQFTDIHYDAANPAAKESLKLIEEVLAAEKPDMVALTGDVVTMRPCFDGWDEVLSVIERFNTPWAAVLGNHDQEQDKTRREIMEYISKRTLALSDVGPEGLKGAGNYVVELREGAKTEFLLYFMDSNDYSHVEGVSGYGWFGHDQVEWYRRLSAGFAERNGGVPVPALAFFHIPLNEYACMTSERKRLKGLKNEAECPGAINAGMFLAMKECGDVMATFVGHDHDNDYIGNYCGIFLAYGRFSGSSTTYTHLTHGARVIELTAGVRGFKTWIRLRGNQIINTVVSHEFK